MNTESRKQAAIILLAIGLGLVASVLMSKVVNDKIDQQTRAIAKEYQGRSAALVKEIESTKKSLNKLSQDYAALSKRVDERPVIQPRVIERKKAPVPKTAFSMRTPPGKRAITMSIDSLLAVGGLVNPGDYVDIIAHLDIPSEDSRKKTKSKSKAKSKANKKDRLISVLFQNIQVLAVGTNYDPMKTFSQYETQKSLKKLNVTFAVSPEEAGLLTFAQAHGSLQLALRSPVETQDRVLQQAASWKVLSDFVLERQGTDLHLPKKAVTKKEKPEELKELEPFIQIFRGGREL